MRARSQVIPADRIARALVVATLLATLVLQGWVLLPAVQSKPDSLLGNVLSLFPSMFAALTCWHVARQTSVSKRAWMVLGAAILSFGCGNLTWLVLQNILGLDPFPSLADVFYLLVPPLIAWGVLCFPRDPFRPTEIARISLNVFIVIAGIGTFFWRFVLAPIIEQGANGNLLAFCVSLAYPISDLIVLTLMLYVVMRSQRPEFRPALTWLLVGVGFLTASDVIFSIVSVNGTEEFAQPADGLWSWFAACFAVAALTHLERTQRSHATPRASVATGLGGTSVTALLAPFIAIIATFVLHAVDPNTDSLGHTGTYIGTITVIVLVMLRQGFAFADNVALNAALRKLSTELEARVVDRTRQMEWNATHDPLTELPNRTLLQTFLEAALEHERVAVLFIDLDGFKRINDTLGHAVGDDLLRAVTARLKRAFTVSELIARTGGDEFVVVLPNISESDVERAALGVIAALRQPFGLRGATFTISASVGYATAPRDGRDAETLQRHADAAMYTAKNRGHGQVQGFTAAIKAQLEERLEIEQQLRHAVSRNELELYFQPIVDAQSGRVHTLEALLRWRSPTLGSVSPERFIPVAEESGLIVPLTEWVLHCACAQNAAWQLAGFAPVCVAVNISMLQIGQPELLRTVEHALELSGLEPRYLQLELVESVLAQPQAASGVSQLRALGVSIAVDDFGTGYSSLSYLGQLPVDTLKIAQAFTTNLYREGSQDSALALLEAITSVAKSLRLRVTAEGVETQQQLDRLRQLGCDSIQGYLYAKPAPALEAVGWLENKQPLEARPESSQYPRA
jgi:diguanylate cyclase (GGDEF)-like protein